MLQNKKYLLVVLGLFIVFGATLFPSKLYAQSLPLSSSCGPNDVPSYSGLFQLDAGQYDAYVKLGKQDQQAPVSLYYQGFIATECQTIGATTASGNAWTKLGNVSFADPKQAFGTYTLASPAIASLPSANRPTVMLIPKNNPVCLPAADCTITLNGKQAILRASGTLLNEDSLHIVTPKDPRADSVELVNYFVDNKLAYSTEWLRAFDMRYVGSDKHTLTTVVHYKSGQQAVISEKVDRPYYDNLNYYSFIFFKQNQTLLTLLFAGVGALLAGWLVLSLVHYIYRRRMWNQHHFIRIRPKAKPANAALKPVLPAASVTLAPVHLLHPDRKREITKKILWTSGALVCIVLLLIISNTWLIQLYAVDGPSMRSTLKSGQELVVDKTPITMARVARKVYIPKRGQIIVFQKQQNPLLGSIEKDVSQQIYVVKRVIGLPGERVVIKNGKTTIYNAQFVDGFNPESNTTWIKNAHMYAFDDIDLTLTGEQLFVMGDNRPESIDSRSFGPISLDQLIGIVRTKF